MNLQVSMIKRAINISDKKIIANNKDNWLEKTFFSQNFFFFLRYFNFEPSLPNPLGHKALSRANKSRASTAPSHKFIFTSSHLNFNFLQITQTVPPALLGVFSSSAMTDTDDNISPTARAVLIVQFRILHVKKYPW